MNARSFARVVPLVLIVAVATGCVSIPESSSVRAGRATSAPDEQPLSSNTPDGPSPGAGRKEIATGYVSALLAFPPAPDVVRQFMTTEAAADWNPQDGLVVYAESNRPRLAEKANSVLFRGRALGSLDDRGTWTTARRGERAVSSDFKMARINGEWRLRNPLRGTYVDEDYFSTYYATFALYFFDATTSILAPDPVHMLLGDSLATSLVEDLLAGPTSQVDGAVSSSVPTSASLDVSVSISAAGVAEIPLSDEILQMSADDRRLFAAQLTWTLRPLQEINTIVVTVDGSRLDLGVGTEISIDSFSGFDPAGLAASRQLYALTGQGLVAVSDTDTTTVSGSILPVSRNARSAAIDPNASLAAVVSADGGTVTIAGLAAADSGTIVWYSGEDVIRPSWDIHETLWMVDNRANGAHLYVADDPDAREVYAPGITGRKVHSIAVSRDGVRLAAVVGHRDDRRLMISVIERDAKNPTRVALRAARRVVTTGVAPARVSSADWVSPTSVATLDDGAGGQLEPLEIEIDGWGVTAFSGFLPTRPVALATGPNVDIPAAISDSRGSVYVQSTDAQWLEIGGSAKIRAPFYPG